MGAQPFMVPAVEALREGFTKGMKNKITMAQVEEHVVTFAFKVEEGAKRRAPRDTGALINSIHVVSGEEFGVTFEQLRKGKAIA